MAVEERKEWQQKRTTNRTKNDSRMQERGKRMIVEENKETMRWCNESSTQEEGNNDNRIERRKKLKDRRKQEGNTCGRTPLSWFDLL